jgi:uncharacterized protein (TIGR02453 family)
MKSSFEGFPKEALTFLRDLRNNNNRDWFLAHKQLYETKLKAPMVEFVLSLKEEMKKIAPEIEVDPKGIFRIYRDIRFSQDKSPYKTHVAASFDPKNLRNMGAGLYIHLEPRRFMIAGGLYHPDSAQLVAVRNQLASQYRKFGKIIEDKEFKRLFGKMEGTQLSRMPRGFAEDHPAADLLRYKQFLAWTELPATVARTSKLVPETVRYFRGMMPMIRFLNGALKKAPSKSWG